MKALDAISQSLRQMGADGLCHMSTACGCGLNDLAPCREWIGDCIAAKAVPVSEASKYGVEIEYEEDYPEGVVYIPKEQE